MQGIISIFSQTKKVEGIPSQLYIHRTVFHYPSKISLQIDCPLGYPERWYLLCNRSFSFWSFSQSKIVGIRPNNLSLG
jgi:hypothetical protein